MLDMAGGGGGDCGASGAELGVRDGDAGAERSPGRARRTAGTELGDRIAEHAFHLDAAMHRLLADLRAFDQAGYWADEGAASCAAWLSWRVGWTPGTGREHVRVANALGRLPLIDGALREGWLSYSKVRAITRIATPATEAALLDDARFATAAQLEIICRRVATVQRLATLTPDDVRARRTVTRRERADGLVVIEAVLPADEAALVFAAIDREAAVLGASGAGPAPAVASVTAMAAPAAATATAASAAPATATGAASPDGSAMAEGAAGVSAATPRPPRPDRADGLLAMCQAVLRGDAPARAPVEVVVTIARDTLAAPSPGGAGAAVGLGVDGLGVDGLGVDGLGVDGPGVDGLNVDALGVGVLADGTCVTAETARRLSCDCGVVTLVQDAAGRTLSVGRRTRTIPAAIARALAQRDVTCRFPGCTNRRYLDGHHIVHWAHGGETSLTNTLRLCTRHHRYVHEHGCRIEWRDGEPVFFAGERQIVAEPPRTVHAPLGWPSIRRDNADADLAIDATTGASRWDGQPAQYDWIVDRLAYLAYRRASEPPTG